MQLQNKAMHWLQLAAIIISGIAVGIADALIKKTGSTGSFSHAIWNPWMIGIIVLYCAQILLFIYAFINKWQLGTAGILQIVFYSITVVLIGILFFGENMSAIRAVGIVLALAGVVLINLNK